MIPTYDGGATIEQTLGSVLQQDPGTAAMQIEVVDDGSPRRDVQALVRSVAGDRVVYFQQQRNVGHVANFNTCIARARVRLVHLLHDDDLVRPGFYAAMQRPFLDRPEIGAAFCRNAYIDDVGAVIGASPLQREKAGVWDDALRMITAHQPIQTPVVVVRRSVCASARRVRQPDALLRRSLGDVGSDRGAPFRGCEPRTLAEYRVREASLTSRSLERADKIRDLQRSIEIYRAYLPDAEQAEIARRARQLAALWGCSQTRRLVRARRVTAAVRQALAVLRCSTSPKVVRKLAAVMITSTARELRRAVGQAHPPEILRKYGGIAD
jgi:glycosyltransferase involved in cell wall biosynthesis